MKHVMTLAAVLLLLAACNTRNVAYHHYTDIAEDGWQYSDTLAFQTADIKEAGNYTTYICLRVRAGFPYRYLAMKAEQQVRPTGTKLQKRLRKEIVDRLGKQTGVGITYFTYEVPMCVQHLEPGDTVDIRVKHDMAREMMPYIMNVGVKIKK